MDKFAQPQRERRLKSGDAERRAVEFNVLARRVVWRVVRSDRINASIRETLN